MWGFSNQTPEQILMKVLRIFSTLGVAVLVSHAALASTSSQEEPAQPAKEVSAKPVTDVTIFHKELAPYGEWLEVADRGWCWSPSGLDVDWRPYTRGRWAWSDADGWVWASDFEWGWAPFHYGRWDFVEDLGWVWIPGTTWGPAWVSWRSGGDHVGWAPLPYSIGFGTELEIGDRDLDRLIRPFWWTFVPMRNFAEEHVQPYAVLAARNATFLRETQPLPVLSTVKGHVFDHGIEVAAVERAMGRRVPHVAIQEAGAEAPRFTRVNDKAITLFRPTIQVNPRAAYVVPATAHLPMVASPMDMEQAKVERGKALEALRTRQQATAAELERVHEAERKTAVDEAQTRAINARHALEVEALKQQHERERAIVVRRFERAHPQGARPVREGDPQQGGRPQRGQEPQGKPKGERGRKPK